MQDSKTISIASLAPSPKYLELNDHSFSRNPIIKEEELLDDKELGHETSEDELMGEDSDCEELTDEDSNRHKIKEEYSPDEEFAGAELRLQGYQAICREIGMLVYSTTEERFEEIHNAPPVNVFELSWTRMKLLFTRCTLAREFISRRRSRMNFSNRYFEIFKKGRTNRYRIDAINQDGTE
ncbi:hypothetical protein CC78DRAFT_589634 [Lojkania enalia]|uniref:Uncharacterized protein n=1 Tax=Lojkania enalia TaxID=147567 RepID=A0A9P4K5I2_9PLEO|nr:hypothetical protein CC78DRAFT_589634 [Didymosphaeria enalia]